MPLDKIDNFQEKVPYCVSKWNSNLPLLRNGSIDYINLFYSFVITVKSFWLTELNSSIYDRISQSNICILASFLMGFRSVPFK